MGIGFTATGATHNDPDPGAGNPAEHDIPTIKIAKSIGFILEPHELSILFLHLCCQAAAVELDSYRVA
jgi:hypothetical protein